MSKGPFELADPTRKSVVTDHNKEFSQEISQIVNG